MLGQDHDWILALHDDVSWQRRKWLALHNIRILRSQVNKQMLNTADRWQPLRKKKAKKSAHRRNQESDRRTRKSSKSTKNVLEILAHAQYLGSLFTLSLFCTVLWVPTKQAMPDTCTCPIRTWRLVRREASYACVVLVRNMGWAIILTVEMEDATKLKTKMKMKSPV